jgi:predicted AlkP superfamily pyrophosphatase or phosphodiesterase
MSTGAYPAVHGNAGYHYDPVRNVSVGQIRDMAAESLTESLGRAGLTVAAVQWYMVEGRGTALGDPGHLYVQPDGSFGNRVDAAVEILHQRPVRSGDGMATVPRVPDFLAVYGSDFDALVHKEGPDSPNVGPLMEELDAAVGRLVQAVEDVGLTEQTAFLVTGDHGMNRWDRTLLPDLLAAVKATGYRPEVVRSGRSPAARTQVVIVPGAVRYGAMSLRGRAATPEAEERIRTALESLSPRLVSGVLDRADLDLLRTSPSVGDLVAEAQPPYSFAPSDLPGGAVEGAHGSRAEMSVPLFVAGAGFRQGSAPLDPELVDLAPTISALLGVPPPAQSQGRVWTEALADVTPRRRTI